MRRELDPKVPDIDMTPTRPRPLDDSGRQYPPDQDAQAALELAPADIHHGRLYLPSKPAAALAISQVPAVGDGDMSNMFVVFLNGLILPKSVWLPVMSAVIDSLRTLTGTDHRPEMLAYDRFGQGLSDRDPLDEKPGKQPGYGHDVMDAVDDLDALINEIQRGGSTDDVTVRQQKRRLVFVASSIGCPLARLYIQKYPNTVVAGIVFLDSMMANENFIDMFPDPTSPDFDPDTLPDGITPAILQEQRRQFRLKFAPDAKNPEGLDRRDMPALLPWSDAPTLAFQEGGQPPFLSVVGHDRETFALQSLEGSMKTPIAFTKNYTQPVWDRYNAGLLKLSDAQRVKGVVIARGCGHFIPADDAAFSAAMVVDMIQRIADNREEML